MKILFRIILGTLLLLKGNIVPAQETKRPARAPFSEEKAAYYHQMALKMGTGNSDVSLLYADSLEKAGRELSNPVHLYNAYKIKGDIYRLTGDYTGAFYWLQLAYNIAQSESDTLRTVRILNNIGAVYQNTGALDKALENYLTTISLGEKYLTPDQKAVVLMNIGMVHEDLNQYEEALSYYKRALRLTEKADSSVRSGLVHNNLGSLYIKLDEKDKAVEHLKIARKLFESQGSEVRLGEVFTAFSQVYLQDNPEISVEYLGLAQKLFKKNQNKAGLFETQKNLGQAYLKLGDFDSARRHLNLALEYSEQLQNDFFKGDIFLALAGLYELQDNYEKASQFYRQFVELDLGRNRNELLQNVVTTRRTFEQDRKDLTIEQLEQKKVKAESQLNFFIILLVALTLFFLLVSGLAFRWGRRERKLAERSNGPKNVNQPVNLEKEETDEKKLIFEVQDAETEKIRKKKDEYYNELILVKNTLEEKVKERTRELEEAFQKLSFHLDNTSLAVMEWNTSHELIHWPKQAETIFGYKAKEVLGLKIEEVPFLQPEDRREVAEILRSLSKGELSSQHYTRKSFNRFGEPCFVEWSFSVLLSPEGEPESFLSVANDVSFREQTFRELKDSNQELDTFLYKSSHDLRGPIARMQGIINLGLIETKEKEASLYFNMLNKVTDELNKVLLRLLMVHNINQHKYQPKPLKFAEFVNSLISAHSKSKTILQEVKIMNNVPSDLILYSDETLLTIILGNLLENGVMFADNFNPVIEIEAVYLPSGKYIINVTDNGVGVPEEYREKIFDMFFQGSTRSTGTGLGLYMVRKAAKKLGGDINLKSRKGETNFEITLPAEKAKNPGKVKVIK